MGITAETGAEQLMRIYTTPGGSARHTGRRFTRRSAPPTPPALALGESLVVITSDGGPPSPHTSELVNHATYAVELHDGQLRVIKDKRTQHPHRRECVVIIHPTATDADVAAAEYETRTATFVCRFSTDRTETVLKDDNGHGTYLNALAMAERSAMIHHDGLFIQRDYMPVRWVA
jgi:hypothetical protein